MAQSTRLLHLIGMGRLVAGLALAAILVASLPPAPAWAGNLPGCCICQACAVLPATQCFESPTQDCIALCGSLDCGSASDTSIPCPNQPQCAPFVPPAPVPALAPIGLSFAALVLAGLGRRAMRRPR